MTPLERLNRMHRELYRKAFEEAMSYGLFPTKNIEVYSLNFEKQLPRNARLVEQKAVEKAMRDNNIVLFGDFHTLRQSQREMLRMIRNAYENHEEECVLALEMVDARHQSHLDDYMEGKTDDVAFLKAIDYERRWGFPWKNYKMIFNFAKQLNIKVFAVNHEAHGKKSLQERDRVIAQRLHEIAQLFPSRRINCLIGEFHLAGSHLPKCLDQLLEEQNSQMSYCRILSNVDKYYFNLGKSVGNLTTDYTELDDNFFCILNTPPWMKWKSLTMWRESQLSIEMDAFIEDDEIADYIDVGFDVEFNFQKILENVCSFLKISDHKELSDVAYLHLCTDADDLSRFITNAKSIRLSFEQVVERCDRDGFFIDDECNIYITNLTLNNLGNICGRYIRKRSLGDFDESELSEEDLFCLKIIEYCCGSIARRIMNPSHKTISIQNFEEFLKTHFRKRLQGFAQEKRDEAKLVLDFHHKMVDRNFSIRSQNTNILNHRDTVFSNGISKMIGEVLGSRMYGLLVGGHASIEDIQKLFRTPLAAPEQAAAILEHIYRLCFTELQTSQDQKIFA